MHGSELTIMLEGSVYEADRIYDNWGPGIFVGNTSTILMKDVEIYQNKGDGVHLRFDSGAQFGANAHIHGNNGFNINCGDQYGDSKYWGEPGFVSGTTNCFTY